MDQKNITQNICDRHIRHKKNILKLFTFFASAYLIFETSKSALIQVNAQLTINYDEHLKQFLEDEQYNEVFIEDESLKRNLQMQQDRDDDTDDDDNLILDGAAEQELNNKQKPAEVEKQPNSEELEAIKSQLKSSSSINVNKEKKNDWDIQDIKTRYEQGNIRLNIESITPRGGPTYGTTRVTVRVSDIEELVDAFPDPKCKFGSNSMIVEATYVKCSVAPKSFYDKDKQTDASNKQATCIECESSPKIANPDLITFTVSLTGRFDDVYSSTPYRYYAPLIIEGIYPRYGPRDGDTVVQVWGQNFMDLGDDFRCNFGTRSTKAYFINEHYIWCRSAVSDVIGRPMPFSISANRQQNSMQRFNFWYYNDVTLMKMIPDYGPMVAGTKILLKGSQFLPFDWKLDINNQNDTFCHWGALGKTPAMVISSNEAECLSPENNLQLTFVTVNLTLNNQNYTDEDIRFYFFNPPNVVDAYPLKGPIRGGTEINIWGTKFDKTREIICLFEKTSVKAKVISKTHLTCLSPNTTKSGDTKLVVKYENDRFESDVLNYQYFDNPEIASLRPICGPISGFTQILVKGKNFVEFGFGKAKCIFNGTFETNATVTDSTTLYCDSPSLENSNGDLWYNISVSLDGEYKSNATQKFYYYDKIEIESISPWMGPIKGLTEVQVTGKGFKQQNVCDFVVKFGQRQIQAKEIKSNTLFTVVSPPASLPGDIVVSISGNNQQFIDDRTLHFRDQENTFNYHQDFVVESAEPEYLSNSGSSPLLLKGILFDQFKYDNGTTRKDVILKCHFLDVSSGNIIGGSINMTSQLDGNQICRAQKSDITGDVKVEISANGLQWQDIGLGVKFYNGPRVTEVNPTYGVTKNPKGLTLEVKGQNFECPNKDCSRIKVRFTNAKGDEIYSDGKLSESGSVITLIPKYPAPETLDVDVSFNGQDYTNDKIKFGFSDPYILDINPRLISTHGTTKLQLSGYGFVQGEDSKSQVAFKAKKQDLQCGVSSSKDGICSKLYHVKNENLCTVDTVDQSQVSQAGKNIAFQAFNVFMMNPDGDFTANKIDLWYYKDPKISNVSSEFAYSNEQKPILFKTDFAWNDGNNYEMFKKFGNFTCRFTGSSNQEVVQAIMEVSPVGQFKKEKLPDQIRCRSPKWGKSDSVKVEVSINGQDYFGDQSLTIIDPLIIDRIYPMAGPIGGATKVILYGQGFTSSLPKENTVFIKFGTFSSQILDKSLVDEYSWSSDDYFQNKMKVPAQLLKQCQAYDAPLDDGTTLKRYISAITPDLSAIYAKDAIDVQNMGGPVYVKIGERIPIQEIEHDQATSFFKSNKTSYLEAVFEDSSNQEFYFYRQPFVKKIEPTSGLTDGGTVIDITGSWFDEKPEYGVFPFCRIGGQIIKGKFIQTNRIQCLSPASGEILAPQALAVSLNGQDFVESGFSFNYYQKPIISSIVPKSGSVEGGTEILLKGEKFSNITSSLKTVKCRFTQIKTDPEESWGDETPPVRYIPAYFIDKETMKCASPSGWTGGDQVKVDLTFNGVDYTDNSFIFSFYNIYGSFPKSGPLDSKNQFIQIRGKGFKPDSQFFCSLKDTKVAPISVHPNLIKCPMQLDSYDKYDAIPFDIFIDGSKFSFGNFRYYKQIAIDNVTPLIAPSEGQGAIYFTGKDFRDDFENAKLGCRIGNTLGFAQMIDSETVRCTLSNKLPLLEEGQSLLVSLALNSYSWASSEFSMKPYGIYNLYPSSGPINQNTNILVLGKGFENELKEFARCRFGTDDNYVVVPAQVLDNEHMICKSPSQEINTPENADSAISVPFSIAFQEDLYYPYTEGPQKFRLYKQPILIDVIPAQALVGRLSEVYVMADDDNGFWQPIPTPGEQPNEQYGIKCKFGRFGTSQGTYINKTTILCLTPNIQDDPNDISTETVQLTVAMNGVDFNDEFSETDFTFRGTGGGVSTWVIIMGTIILGLLVVAILIFMTALKEFLGQRQRQGLISNVEPNENGRNTPRRESRASRGSQQVLSVPRPRSYQQNVPNSRAQLNPPRSGFGYQNNEDYD